MALTNPKTHAVFWDIHGGLPREGPGDLFLVMAANDGVRNGDPDIVLGRNGVSKIGNPLGRFPHFRQQKLLFQPADQLRCCRLGRFSAAHGSPFHASFVIAACTHCRSSAKVRPQDFCSGGVPTRKAR
jgi:hypothetical protein